MPNSFSRGFFSGSTNNKEFSSLSSRSSDLAFAENDGDSLSGQSNQHSVTNVDTMKSDTAVSDVERNERKITSFKSGQKGSHQSLLPPHKPLLLLAASTRPHTLGKNELGFLLRNNAYEECLVKNACALAFSYGVLCECFRHWDLRITCGYNYIPEEDIFELSGMTMHGMWESNMRGSRIAPVPHPMDYAELKRALAVADRLYNQLDPAFLAKMNEIWWTTNHTYANHKLHMRQMVEHGYLSSEYWKKAVQIALPFLADDGEFNLMKILEEEGFVKGIFEGEDLKNMLARRTGRVVNLLFIRMRGKIYIGEFALLHSLEHKFLSHPPASSRENLPSFVLEKPKPKK